MTPAEKMARDKRRKPYFRTKPVKKQRVIWRTTLKASRDALGLSARDVATGIKMSLAGYYRVECGYADPSLSTVAKLAGFFGKSFMDLWPEHLPKAGPPQ